jgi:ABC-type nitrate/sulfonate/bicarbonate transport system permease component
MKIKSWFRPFEQLPSFERSIIFLIWFLSVLIYWLIVSSIGEKHLFPTPGQVLEGFSNLYKEGLVVHIFSSLGLCLQATIFSIICSLLIAYMVPIPFLLPISTILSKMRYLPLTGITFYLTLAVSDARDMQVWVLVIFMSLYFITSLIAVIKDIPAEEIDHARSLKCSRMEILWEIVAKGRMDYVLDVLRQNLAITWMMLVTVESILVAAGGLGVLIKNSDKFMNHGRIVALQIVILLVGLGIDWSINTFRKGLFRFSKFN